MIRIDEIYNNTFRPWIKQHLPLTRMFFCDPPGRTDADALLNFGDDVTELNYIFFHDQEPIHLDIHKALFDLVVERNLDLDNSHGARFRGLVTSEYNSEFVEACCARYGWQAFYYFFHGWAALDWYRGYDRTFLIPPPDQRCITRSFISANRIIGGKRDHRVMLMHHLMQQKIHNALISFPAVCPAENVPVSEIAQKMKLDISQTLMAANLPMNFPGEQDHPMHSCWLSLFDENAQCLAHVVTETVFHGRRNHLTEKIFKPICLRMPFVLVSSAGSLEYLRRYGFQTFDDIWPEDYDHEIDDEIRIRKISALLKNLDQCTARELQQMYRAAWPKIEHNYRHFYGGDFEKILWDELQTMLDNLHHSCLL